MNNVECRYRVSGETKPLCKLIGKRQTTQMPVDGQYHVPYCLHLDMGHKKPNLCPVINPVEGSATIIDVPPKLPSGE